MNNPALFLVNRREQGFVRRPYHTILASPAFIQTLVDVLHTTLVESVKLFEGLKLVIDGLLFGCLVQLELDGYNLQAVSFGEIRLTLLRQPYGNGFLGTIRRKLIAVKNLLVSLSVNVGNNSLLDHCKVKVRYLTLVKVDFVPLIMHIVRQRSQTIADDNAAGFFANVGEVVLNTIHFSHSRNF